MATYAEQLRERLAQITGNAEAATTWEQLKAARERSRSETLRDVAMLNAQTDAYKQRLMNLMNMTGTVSKPAAVFKPKTQKKQTRVSATDPLELMKAIQSVKFI